MKSKRVPAFFIALVGISFLLNYNWVHAALVHSITSESCSPALLKTSKKRVETLFGDVESSPLISCLTQPTLGLGKIIGTTSFAPGLPAVILVSPQGATVDVVAHEWAHAEFAHRVGVLTRTFRVPTWFDEGLAMQVDYRKNYNLAVLARLSARQDLIPVDETALSKPSGYYKAGAQGVLHYAWARDRVSQWLMTHQLKQTLEQSSLFRSFQY